MFKKAVFLIVAALIIMPLVIVAGCGGGGGPSTPISLVPSSVNFIGQVDLNAILTDTDFAALYDESDKSPGDPATWEEALDELKAESNIDLRDIKEMVFFGDTTKLDTGSL